MFNITKDLSFLPLKRKWIITSAVAATLLTMATTLHSLSRFQTSLQSSSSTSSIATVSPTSTITAVTALGYLEPQGEVINVSTSSLTPEGGSTRISQLLVKEGDKVKAGQVIAILDTHHSRLAALQQAKAQVTMAQARLIQIKAGAKIGEIAAQKATITRLQAEMDGQVASQKATIARLEAELNNAEIEYQRYQKLYKEGATSASVADSKHLTLKTVREQLNEARATLNRIVNSSLEQIKEARATLHRIAEVRPIDVDVVESEVSSAKAAVQRAQADLELTQVRAPKNGQILQVHTWPGEIVSSKGIVSLGQTDQMYAVAEVYEIDINRVRVGQRATITSKNGGFQGKLSGIVTQIGREIGKKDVLDTDPAADVDARVVEAKIRLDAADSTQVKDLTNLQVQVVIDS